MKTIKKYLKLIMNMGELRDLFYLSFRMGKIVSANFLSKATQVHM